MQKGGIFEGLLCKLAQLYRGYLNRVDFECCVPVKHIIVVCYICFYALFLIAVLYHLWFCIGHFRSQRDVT